MNWTRRRVLEVAGQVGLGGAILPWAAGCMKAVTVAVPPSTPPLPATGTTGDDSLKAHASAKGLLFGCAVATELLGVDTAYEQLVRDQCSIVVAENAMKWGPLRPAIGTFYFDDADRLVAFAEANQMRVRGHNLCWHRQLPKWFGAYATKSNASKLLSEHIQNVAGRYAGRIHSWDVVNEAVLPTDGRPDGLRKSRWLELIGPGYVDLAFRTAREADPKALLTYNEYGIESEDGESAAKRKAVLDLLFGMKTRGVPIDAVGSISYRSDRQLWRWFKRLYGISSADGARDLRHRDGCQRPKTYGGVVGYRSRSCKTVRGLPGIGPERAQRQGRADLGDHGPEYLAEL